jgi:hypothetical protein
MNIDAYMPVKQANVDSSLVCYVFGGRTTLLLSAFKVCRSRQVSLMNLQKQTNKLTIIISSSSSSAVLRATHPACLHLIVLL